MKSAILITVSLVTISFCGDTLNDLVYNAQQGDVNAQEELGEYYYREASDFNFKSQVYHHPNAKERYRYDIEENTYRALKWLRKAAENGSRRAYYYLGNYYGDREWGIHNVDSAFYFWNEGAKLGDKYSQHKLAYLYLHGIGCDVDIKKAHILSWKSFLKGDLTVPFTWLVKWFNLDV